MQEEQSEEKSDEEMESDEHNERTY